MTYQFKGDVSKQLQHDVAAFNGNEDTIQFLSQIFKSLSDPTRLKIIYALSRQDLCVTDIAELLEMSQSSISHQLALLRNLQLIKVTKEGRKAIYSLDDEHVLTLFKQGYEHAEHKK